MMERLFNKGAIPALEKMISFTGRRHKVLANNIANADTVFYKAEDLPVEKFQTVLRRSIDDRRRHPVGVFRWQETYDLQENSLGGIEVTSEAIRGRRANRGSLRHDKNNVSVEREMAKMNRNALMHQAMLDLLRKQFQMIDGALSERIE